MVLVITATKDGMTGGAAKGWESSLERFAEQLALMDLHAGTDLCQEPVGIPEVPQE